MPDKTAIVCGQSSITYRDLCARAYRLAWALQRHGIRAGDRVLMLSGNTIDAAVSFWGILAANGVAVPIHPHTRSDRLRWQLDHCRASALISEYPLAPVFVPALQASCHLRTVVVSDLAGWIDNWPGVTDFASALAGEPGDGPPPVQVDQGNLAALIYTSASTGPPKGVMLTHANMVSAAESICQYLELREDDVIHGIMPMAFDYGLYQLLLSVRQGARLVLAPPWGLPAQVLKQAAAEGVTFFPGIPTVFAMLDELKDVSRWNLSRVRAVTSTAAPLMERHIATIRRLFPAARIFSMYGVTECKRCTYLPPDDLGRKPGSVGIAIPDTELWLVDDQDRRLGPNQVGQIVVRGPTVMRGYWENPQATSERLRPGPEAGELVLYTGDLGRLDDDGYLYFVGRMDDMIKSGGEKVSPKEIETVLGAIPGVKEAAVIGVADQFLGQAVKAFVALDEGATLSESAVLRACRNQLAGPMVPRSIAFVPSLPKSPNGKIDKLALCGSSHHPAD